MWFVFAIAAAFIYLCIYIFANDNDMDHSRF